MFSQLIKRGRRRPLFVPDAASCAVDLPVERVKQMLPHRESMLLVDAIDNVDLGARALSGRRRLDPADPVFRGHFPGDPVYPGALQMEMIGQIGICLLHLLDRGSAQLDPSDAPRPVRLLKVHHASFLGELRPGDEVQLIASCIEESDFLATCAGQVCIAGAVRSLAIFDIYLLDT